MTKLLNLPEVEVESYQEVDDILFLEIESTKMTAVCPRCKKESGYLHQNHRYLARDLSISNREVYLRVNRRQFKCHPCGKPFSEGLGFIESRRKYTNRFAEMIVEQVIHSDIHNVGVQNNISDEVVWLMVKQVSKKNSSLI